MLAGNDIREDEVLEKHADWVDEFLPKYSTITADNIHEIIQKEIGLVFNEVLKDAGVYKCDQAGREGFLRFVASMN